MRAAAALGGVSNTTWSRYEAGGVTLTPGIVQGVAKAFGWPTTWPEEQPATTTPDFEARLQRLEDVVWRLVATSTESDLASAESLAALSDHLEAERRAR